MHATKELIPLDRIALAVEKITAIMTPILQKAGIEDADFPLSTNC